MTGHGPYDQQMSHFPHEPASHIVAWPSPETMAVFGDRDSVLAVLTATSAGLHGCVSCTTLGSFRVAASRDALVVLARMRYGVEHGVDPFHSPDHRQLITERIDAMDQTERLGFAVAEIGNLGVYVREALKEQP